MKQETARVFLSYGRNDAHQLANRLLEELTKRNFDVWIDQERIRGGKEWETQILDGLLCVSKIGEGFGAVFGQAG